MNNNVIRGVEAIKNGWIPDSSDLMRICTSDLNLEIVKQLLKTDFDPSGKANFMLTMAFAEPSILIINLLLSDKRVRDRITTDFIKNNPSVIPMLRQYKIEALQLN